MPGCLRGSVDAVRLTQGNDDHAGVMVVEMGNGMEEVAVGGQKDGVFFAGLLEKGMVIRTLSGCPPDVDDAVTPFFQLGRSGLWKVLVEEELHRASS